MFLFLYPAIHDVAFSIKEGKTFSSNNVWLSSFFSFYTFYPFSFSSVDALDERYRHAARASVSRKQGSEYKQRRVRDRNARKLVPSFL